MSYNRIFTFGCSWTRYIWPTWADMIRYSTDIPVENWGGAGLGNVAIMHQMLECDLRNQFTDKDLIITQWTNWTREDRMANGKWVAVGNIFNNSHYDSKFIEKYWNWENDIVKNAGAILSANKMFNINYQFNMIPYKEKEVHSELRTARIGHLAKLLEKSLPEIDNFPNELNTMFNGNSTDVHPDIKTHLHFFNNYIKDRFNLDLSSTEHDLLELHERISNRLTTSIKPGSVLKSIQGLVEQFDKNFYTKEEEE